jgi:hypothetical protein
LSSRAKWVKLNPRAELAGLFQVSVDVLTAEPSGWLVIPPMVMLPLCKAMLICAESIPDRRLAASMDRENKRKIIRDEGRQKSSVRWTHRAEVKANILIGDDVERAPGYRGRSGQQQSWARGLHQATRIDALRNQRCHYQQIPETEFLQKRHLSHQRNTCR